MQSNQDVAIAASPIATSMTEGVERQALLIQRCALVGDANRGLHLLTGEITTRAANRLDSRRTEPAGAHLIHRG